MPLVRSGERQKANGNRDAGGRVEIREGEAVVVVLQVLRVLTEPNRVGSLALSTGVRHVGQPLDRLVLHLVDRGDDRDVAEDIRAANKAVLRNRAGGIEVLNGEGGNNDPGIRDLTPAGLVEFAVFYNHLTLPTSDLGKTQGVAVP